MGRAAPGGRSTAPSSALRRSRTDYITQQWLVKSGYRSKTGTEVWTTHFDGWVQMALGFSTLPAQDSGLLKPSPILPTVATTVLKMRCELGL